MRCADKEEIMEKKNSRVIKAGIGYTVGNYMLKGLSFLTVPVFSRLLSTSEYGIFNTYLAYQTILFLLIGLALHTSLKNARYKYGENFARYNSNCILLALVSLLIWLLLGNLLYPLYGTWLGFSRVIVNLLLLDSFGTALIQFFNVYVGLDYQYTAFLKISAFNALANLGLSVFFILTVFRSDRAIGRILGNALPVILIAVVIIWYFWRQAKPVPDKEYVRYAVSYSLPLIPHGISQVILSQFDRIMIQNMIGSAQAGIYSFGYTIFSIINVTANSLDNVWGPWFYEKMAAERYDDIRKAGSKYAFGMMVFSGMVMLGTPELVKLLGAKEYWDAMYSVIPIVVGGYFMFLYTFPSCVEYYYEKTKYIALGTGMAAGINIILNFLFIRKFGYLAAAYTTLVTYLLYFVFHYIIAWRVQKGCIFDTGKLVCYSVGTMAAGAVSLFLVEYWLVRWMLLAGLGIFFLWWAEHEFEIGHRLKEKFAGK